MSVFISLGSSHPSHICWIPDHYHPCSNPGEGISAGCFIFDFTSLPLEVTRPIQPTLCTKVAANQQSSSSSQTNLSQTKVQVRIKRSTQRFAAQCSNQKCGTSLNKLVSYVNIVRVNTRIRCHFSWNIALGQSDHSDLAKTITPARSCWVKQVKSTLIRHVCLGTASC